MTDMLDERKAAILRAVIEEYIDTAQPVGSSAVLAATDIKVSPATVRNDMVALENDGYLAQPHTSAGRIPTEKGYRHFVDNLSAAELPGVQRRKVSVFFDELKGEIEGVMRETAGLLAHLTDYAAVVVDDTEEAVNVRSIQVVGLTETVVLVVVVLANGQVTKHTLTLDEPLSDGDLAEIGRALQEAFDDRPVTDPAPLRLTGQSRLDDLADLTRTVLASANPDPGRVYVDGTSRVVNAFEAVGSVSRVLTILEQQLLVVNLLADVVDRGLTVAIGSETGVEPLAECSLVVSPYEIGGEHAGSIAVLGPTRMNYSNALSAVAAVSRQLGHRLSEV